MEIKNNQMKYKNYYENYYKMIDKLFLECKDKDDPIANYKMVFRNK